MRPGQSSDAGWMYEIELDNFPAPWDDKSFAKDIWQDPFHVLVETSFAGEGRGYLIYQIVMPEIHLLNLAVRRDCQRSGIASYLLGQFHSLLAEQGNQTVFLELRESNLAALALYGNFGYKLLGKRRSYYSDNHEDALVMVKPLGKEAARND